MSNVVQLNVPSPKQREAAQLAALLETFSGQRRFGDDVFWLKENAELLNILECTGATLSEDQLAPLAGFYENVEKRMGFFPQYYRFLLSICLDLEDLGMDQGKGAYLVDWVASQGLVDSELSDLQRGEARRLMARRGVDPLPHDLGLEDRMRGFAERSGAFTLPNKKIAYELTHTVFYLSEYGRRDPNLGTGTEQSLRFAGTLAFLDQNADLLAEICVSLRFMGQVPPQTWENWLFKELRFFEIAGGDDVSIADDYHEYFVSNWASAVAGQGLFKTPVKPGRSAFYRNHMRAAPLRELSECIFRLENRSDDWERMRPLVVDALSEEAHSVLIAAEDASDGFDAFFAGFARCGMQERRA